MQAKLKKFPKIKEWRICKSAEYASKINQVTKDKRVQELSCFIACHLNFILHKTGLKLGLFSSIKSKTGSLS